MTIRPTTFLFMLGLVVCTTSNTLAQEPSNCDCTDVGAARFHPPDTVFHATPGFDVAYCGHIDRTASPIVYSKFTLWTCGFVRDSLEVRATSQGHHLYVSRSLFIVEALALLPTGADMRLTRRPCWRTEHRLFVEEDSSAFAVAGPITELIAKFQQPTADQVAQVQARLDAMPPSLYWSDDELLGQVFLCALFYADWATRFRELPGKYRMVGAKAELYDEFLSILHEKRR
jgi:hypothetical protein